MTTALPGLRSIALPTEHGGWGFTLEPLILGLLAAPSIAGAALATAAVALFLARRPWRLFVEDRRRGRNLPRTRLAGQVVADYLAIAAAGAFIAAVTAAAVPGAARPLAIPAAAVAALAALHFVAVAFLRRPPALARSIACSQNGIGLAVMIAAGLGYRW